jgi:hypothetical protein
MGKHIGIVVDWYGPYKSIQEARKVSKIDYEDGLYLFIGRQKNQQSSTNLLYVGISGSLQDRLTPQHPILSDISGDPIIWLGEIASYGIPGPASQNLMHLAEWATAYFLQLPLNTKKTYNPPNFPVTVVNRWWKRDYKTRRKQRPHPDWPDVFDFPGREFDAKVGWIGYSERWRPKDF